LLERNIKVFKEFRPSLLETLVVLRKKFKMWPQQIKYHSLESEDNETECNVPIL